MKPHKLLPLLPKVDDHFTRPFPPSTKKKRRDTDKDSCCCCSTPTGAILTMLVRLLALLAFTACTVLGLTVVTKTNPLVAGYFYSHQKASSKLSFFTNNNTVNQSFNCDAVTSRKNATILESFLTPENIFHNMTDDELLWRASMVPMRVNVSLPFRRIPKIAFLFLTRGELPFAPLWDRFFLTAPSPDLFSIYIHTSPGFNLSVPRTSPFNGRQIPSQFVKWGFISLVDAERRLLANALLDYRNERFVLLSESCIPVYNFSVVYDYLISSDSGAFVESYDDISGKGRGRYRAGMKPDILLRDWRKGSQWFELSRELAVPIVADAKYLEVFRKFCFPDCFTDEHYLPTFLQMFHGERNANRTLNWVDWSKGGRHPTTYVREGDDPGSIVTPELIRSIQVSEKGCLYRGKNTSVCHLFARKFEPAALGTLLNISDAVMGY